MNESPGSNRFAFSTEPRLSTLAPRTGRSLFRLSGTRLGPGISIQKVEKKEVLYRRIGINENDAIEICYALVQSQRDYASAVRGGESSKHYAVKFLSDEGKQNGLYWNTSGEEPPSPIGPLIADATSQGYTNKAAPFHGYYFRILTKQGAASKGGAKDYVVNGQLARGFAFVAYPAQHKNSGVMTFIVNQNGIVHQKDLGPDTQSIASAMTEYNPDDTWDPVDR